MVTVRWKIVGKELNKKVRMEQKSRKARKYKNKDQETVWESKKL